MVFFAYFAVIQVPGSGFRVFRGATGLFLSVCSVLSVANLLFLAPFAVNIFLGSFGSFPLWFRLVRVRR